MCSTTAPGSRLFFAHWVACGAHLKARSSNRVSASENDVDVVNLNFEMNFSNDI